MQALDRRLTLSSWLTINVLRLPGSKRCVGSQPIVPGRGGAAREIAELREGRVDWGCETSQAITLGGRARAAGSAQETPVQGCRPTGLNPVRDVRGSVEERTEKSNRVGMRPSPREIERNQGVGAEVPRFPGGSPAARVHRCARLGRFLRGLARITQDTRSARWWSPGVGAR